MPALQQVTIPVARSGRSAMDCARAWAEEAGALALERFRQPQGVTVKGRGDLLTETDIAVEDFLKKSIAAEFPEHGILSEESTPATSTVGWAWIVDPLDGTKNFASGIPFFCVNIALCIDGEPVVGVTADPNHRETFWAQRGSGAWLNDSRVRASEKVAVRDSVLGIDLGYDDERGREMLGMAYRLFPGIQSLRIPGSAALGFAYAACGRYDLFAHYFLFPWDLAPGLLLVREAGGEITDRVGSPIELRSRTALAGGRSVHADFLNWRSANGVNLDEID
jgi:fructose-1,6-bisphosphatase/inositol monophosphatase family enzyme